MFFASRHSSLAANGRRQETEKVTRSKAATWDGGRIPRSLAIELVGDMQKRLEKKMMVHGRTICQPIRDCALHKNSFGCGTGAWRHVVDGDEWDTFQANQESRVAAHLLTPAEWKHFRPPGLQGGRKLGTEGASPYLRYVGWGFGKAHREGTSPRSMRVCPSMEKDPGGRSWAEWTEVGTGIS